MLGECVLKCQERGKSSLRLIILALLGAAAVAAAQSPGDLPPQTVADELRTLAHALAEHMNDGNQDAIAGTVDNIRDLLGPYAGIPESPETYVAPIIAAPPVEAVAKAFWTSLEVLRDRQGAASEVAEGNHTELRGHAYLAMAAMTMAALYPDKRSGLIALAEDELDYLVDRQDPNGLFPYPASPVGAAPENVRQQVARMAREHPEALRDGYLYLDVPDMQFDVGCCGVALCAGYEATGDDRYRAAAAKAADWALEIPMSANWNYNAFSVWLLARTYEITGEKKYLDGAVHKTRLGVLPGLMENGRWVDQHNAKQSYHFIMVRALSDLLNVLPEDHTYRGELAGKLERAVDARVEDILRDGVSNFSSAVWGLSTVLKNQPSTPNRWRAAHATVNAILNREDPTGDALMLAFYLEARNTQKPAEQQ
jgi:hypothetical protein